MRKGLLGAALLVTCSILLGATIFREQAVQAVQSAQAILNVRVVNTELQAVPVSVRARTLRASADLISGTRVTVPPGTVLTDVVMSSGDPDCMLFSVDSFENPGGRAGIVIGRPVGELTAQLHLETGVLSTAEHPLTIAVQVNCAATIFWSGYEQ